MNAKRTIKYYRLKIKMTVRHWFRRRYGDGSVNYPGIGVITDADVYKFTMKHLHWWDKLNPKMVGFWSLTSQYILMRIWTVKKEKGDDWYYPLKLDDFEE